MTRKRGSVQVLYSKMADEVGVESALGIIAVSVFLGAVGLAAFVFFTLKKSSQKSSEQEKPKESKESAVQKEQNGHKRQQPAKTSKKKSSNTLLSNHKRQYAILKGHTDKVFDLDFSQNGKYLASVAQGGVFLC